MFARIVAGRGFEAMDPRCRRERRKRWLIGEKIETPVDWNLKKLRRFVGKIENWGLRVKRRLF